MDLLSFKIHRRCILCLFPGSLKAFKNHWSKEHTGAEPRPPCTYVADVQLGLHVGPEQLEQGLSQKLLPDYVLLAGLPCLASVAEDASSLIETS